jgi:tRNA-splicing ligase RtcB
MTDGCAVIRGLGNPLSLNSSSHGAGRVCSRSEAKKTLDVELHALEMEDIVCDNPLSTLDESKQAYKNFFEVLELQEELIEVLEFVKPLLNRKDAKPSEEEC